MKKLKLSIFILLACACFSCDPQQTADDVEPTLNEPQSEYDKEKPGKIFNKKKPA